MRAAASYVTEVAQRVTTVAFQSMGGGALFDTNPLQRCFRDIYAAGQHLMVNSECLAGAQPIETQSARRKSHALGAGLGLERQFKLLACCHRLATCERSSTPIAASAVATISCA